VVKLPSLLADIKGFLEFSMSQIAQVYQINSDVIDS
jgi:hypothetical protein